jgi:hypothetical protein
MFSGWIISNITIFGSHFLWLFDTSLRVRHWKEFRDGLYKDEMNTWAQDHFKILEFSSVRARRLIYPIGKCFFEWSFWIRTSLISRIVSMIIDNSSKNIFFTKLRKLKNSNELFSGRNPTIQCDNNHIKGHYHMSWTT